MRISKDVTVTEEIEVSIECDICGDTTEDLENSDWYRFMHGHRGWGHDSCDSIKYFDVCSVECYRKQLELSIKEIGEDIGAEIDEKSIGFVKKLCEALK